jgi:hypothetical protein
MAFVRAISNDRSFGLVLSQRKYGECPQSAPRVERHSRPEVLEGSPKR